MMYGPLGGRVNPARHVEDVATPNRGAVAEVVERDLKRRAEARKRSAERADHFAQEEADWRAAARILTDKGDKYAAVQATAEADAARGHHRGFAATAGPEYRSPVPHADMGRAAQLAARVVRLHAKYS